MINYPQGTDPDIYDIDIPKPEPKGVFCDNCEETVSHLVDYLGDKVCGRCAEEWRQQDAEGAAFEYRHQQRF